MNTKTIRKIFPVLVGLLAVVAAAGCGGSRTAVKAEAAAGDNLPVRQLGYADARRFDALFLEAVRQKQKENYDAEYELLDAALAISPDAPEALYEMALLKLSFRSMNDTLRRVQGDSLLQLAVRYAPENTDYKETLANHLARSGDYKAAISIYRALAEKKPTVETLSVLAALQEEAADYAGAVRTIEKMEQTDGRNEAYSLEKFKMYDLMGDKARAYAAIEELCAEYPADLTYRVLLGDLYQQQGYGEMALAVYKDVLASEPDNSYAQISLLAYYKKAGEDSLYNALIEDVVLNPNAQNEAKVEAMRGYVADNLVQHADSTPVLRLFERVLEQPQENRALGELCARYMTAKGMPAEALAPVMRRILEVEPDYTMARMQLLDILIRANDMEGVADLCREGSIYDPTRVVFYYYEGLARLNRHEDEAALKCLMAGAEHIDETTDKELASGLYATLGDLLHERGEKQKAYEAYDMALEYKGDNLVCLNNYAYFLSLDGQRLEYAQAMSRRTIDAEPGNATYMDTYAWILFCRKQYTQARIYIDQLLGDIEETAENATLFDHAGDIYYRVGERNAAVKFWIKSLGLSEDDTLRSRLRVKIRRRRI